MSAEEHKSIVAESRGRVLETGDASAEVHRHAQEMLKILDSLDSYLKNHFEWKEGSERVFEEMRDSDEARRIQAKIRHDIGELAGLTFGAPE